MEEVGEAVEGLDFLELVLDEAVCGLDVGLVGVGAGRDGVVGGIGALRAAGRAEPPFGTFHDFAGEDAAAGEPRIDWILTRGAVTTRSTEIITFARYHQYPSDHFPVLARLELDDCG